MNEVPTELPRGIPWSALALGGIGALLGGIVGFALIYAVDVHVGRSVLALGGFCVGGSCGMLSGRRLWALAVWSALVTIPVEVVAEWKLHPFVRDHSLPFFLRHLGDLTFRFWLAVIVSIVFALYFGIGRDRRPAVDDEEA